VISYLVKISIVPAIAYPSGGRDFLSIGISCTTWDFLSIFDVFGEVYSFFDNILFRPFLINPHQEKDATLYKPLVSDLWNIWRSDNRELKGSWYGSVGLGGDLLL